MKIVQILINEGELIGLDEQGQVYIYRRASEPVITKVPSMQFEPVSFPAPDPIAEYYSNRIQNSPDTQLQMQRRQQMEREACFAKIAAQRTICVDKYIDGYTAGWVPLHMGLSKPIPHPDDPTKAERS